MTRPLIGASTFIWESPFTGASADLVDRVAGLGFDLIEICLEQPDQIDASNIAMRIRAAGLSVTACGAFGPGRDISSTDPAIRENGLKYIRDCIDAADRLGARVLAGPMYSETGKTALRSAEEKAQQWQWGEENLRRAADIAADRGIRLAIEPLNRFETDFVNTVEQGIELIARIDRDNVGLLLDTFHMNIEERSIPPALRSAGKHLFHFHACANDRGTPGKDHLPWHEIVAALNAIDYRGAWVIESFTPDNQEIARAVSLWRPLAVSQDGLAADGRAFLANLLA